VEAMSGFSLSNANRAGVSQIIQVSQLYYFAEIKCQLTAQGKHPLVFDCGEHSQELKWRRAAMLIDETSVALRIDALLPHSAITHPPEGRVVA
jgi:hypothetical protein